jgi:hypothetical protein
MAHSLCLQKAMVAHVAREAKQATNKRLSKRRAHKTSNRTFITISTNKSTMSGKGKGGRGEKKSTTSSAKAGLQFPVGRIGT